MEIQELDFDAGLSLTAAINISDDSLESISLYDAIQSSSSGGGWKRLKSESYSLPLNIDPIWVNDDGTKLTDISEDLDDELYEKTMSALAEMGIPNLNDYKITNQKIDALSPLVRKIIDLVTPTDDDTKAKNKEKIDLLGQLAGANQDSAVKKLLEKDIEELKAW